MINTLIENMFVMFIKLVFYAGIWTSFWLSIIWLNAQHEFMLIEGAYYLDRLALYGAYTVLILTCVIVLIRYVRKVMGIRPHSFIVKF